MSRNVCARWLVLAAVLLFVFAIFVAAALPLDSNRQIDLAGNIQFKSQYVVEAHGTSHMILFSARKLSHVIPFGILFALVYVVARRKRALVATLVTSAVAILVEIEQGFIASRSAKVDDLAALFVAIPLSYFAIRAYELHRSLPRSQGVMLGYKSDRLSP